MPPAQLCAEATDTQHLVFLQSCRIRVFFLHFVFLFAWLLSFAHSVWPARHRSASLSFIGKAKNAFLFHHIKQRIPTNLLPEWKDTLLYWYKYALTSTAAHQFQSISFSPSPWLAVSKSNRALLCVTAWIASLRLHSTIIIMKKKKTTSNRVARNRFESFYFCVNKLKRFSIIQPPHLLSFCNDFL